MDKGQGYIKMWRCVRDNWIFDNPIDYWRFSFLLFAAYYEPTEVKGHKTHQIIRLDRGEMIFSIRSLATKWRCSRGAVTRFLNLLESEKMISHSGTRDGTIIKVLNYDVFQGLDTVSQDSKEDKNRDTDETQTGHRRVTKNKLKNIKNIKNIKENIEPCGFGDEWE